MPQKKKKKMSSKKEMVSKDDEINKIFVEGDINKIAESGTKHFVERDTLDLDYGKPELMEARNRYNILPNYYGISTTRAKLLLNNKLDNEKFKKLLTKIVEISKTKCNIEVTEVKESPQMNYVQVLAECKNKEEKQKNGCGIKSIFIIDKNSNEKNQQCIFWFATSRALNNEHVNLDEKEAVKEEDKLLSTNQIPFVKKVKKCNSEPKMKLRHECFLEDLDATDELKAARLIYQIPPYNKNSEKIFYGIESIKTDQISSEALQDKVKLRWDIRKILANEKVTCEVKMGDVEMNKHHVRIRKGICNHAESGGCTNEFLLIVTDLELRENTIHVYATTRSIRETHLVQGKFLQVRGSVRDEFKKTSRLIQPSIATTEQVRNIDLELAAKGNRTFLNQRGSVMSYAAKRQEKSETILENRNFVCPKLDLSYKQGNGYVVSSYFTDLNKKKIGNTYSYTSEFQVVCVNKRLTDSLQKREEMERFICFADATGNMCKLNNCTTKNSESKETSSEASKPETSAKSSTEATNSKISDLEINANASKLKPKDIIDKPCGKLHKQTRILNYIGAIEYETKKITAFEIISSCHKTEDLVRAFTDVKDYYLKELGYIPFKLFVSDYCEAQIHALLEVFCGTTFVDYVNAGFAGNLDPAKMIMIALCHVHVIHRVAKHTKDMTNVDLRNLILDFFALLIDTDSLLVFKKLIKLALFLVSSPTRTNAVAMSCKEFEKLRTSEIKQVVKDVIEEQGRVKDEKDNDVTEEIGVDKQCDIDQLSDDEQVLNETQTKRRQKNRRSQITDYVEFKKEMKEQIKIGQQQTGSSIKNQYYDKDQILYKEINLLYISAPMWSKFGYKQAYPSRISNMTVEAVNKNRKHQVLNKGDPVPISNYLHKVQKNEDEKIVLAENKLLREQIEQPGAKIKSKTEPRKFSYYNQQHLQKLKKRMRDTDNETLESQPKQKKQKSAKKKLQFSDSDIEGTPIEETLNPSIHEEGWTSKAGKISPGLKKKRVSQKELDKALRKLSQIKEKNDELNDYETSDEN